MPPSGHPSKHGHHSKHEGKSSHSKHRSHLTPKKDDRAHPKKDEAPSLRTARKAVLKKLAPSPEQETTLATHWPWLWYAEKSVELPPALDIQEAQDMAIR
eukprot:g8450.t1